MDDRVVDGNHQIERGDLRRQRVQVVLSIDVRPVVNINTNLPVDRLKLLADVTALQVDEEYVGGC